MVRRYQGFQYAIQYISIYGDRWSWYFARLSSRPRKFPAPAGCRRRSWTLASSLSESDLLVFPQGTLPPDGFCPPCPAFQVFSGWCRQVWVSIAGGVLRQDVLVELLVLGQTTVEIFTVERRVGLLVVGQLTVDGLVEAKEGKETACDALDDSKSLTGLAGLRAEAQVSVSPHSYLPFHSIKQQNNKISDYGNTLEEEQLKCFIRISGLDLNLVLVGTTFSTY